LTGQSPDSEKETPGNAARPRHYFREAPPPKNYNRYTYKKGPLGGINLKNLKREKEKKRKKGKWAERPQRPQRPQAL
jgi:hypothetical protein